MKRRTAILSLLAAMVMTTAVHAVTYPFLSSVPAHMAHDAVLRAGARLCLFQSGTMDVKNTIHVDDVLTVYRGYPPSFVTNSGEVGKVRILATLGDYYFRGEVVEGEVQPGNLAKKGAVACFVTSLVYRDQR